MDTKFFDSLAETLTKTAKELSGKTESFYGKQKLRGQVLTEQRAVEKALSAIGKVIYDRYEAGEEMAEDLADLCVEVKNHYDKIAALKDTIADKSGKKVCPSCGKSMGSDAACGAAYPEEEVVDVDAEEIFEAVDEAAEEVKEAAGEVVENLSEDLAEAAEEVKSAVEEMIEEVADAVEEATEE